jgi:cell division protease FtsH
MALGLTQQVPIDDRHTYTREFLTHNLAILFGGRVAEELCLQHMTTGAGNDLERATDLARKMVCEWGMSERLGPMTFGKKEEQIFLGRDFTQLQDYSNATAEEIDKEVRRLIQEAYERAKALLTANLHVLHRMAEALLERESIDGADIDEILKQLGAKGGAAASEPVAAAAS